MFCRLRQCRQILPKLNLSAILLLFLIKRAALGNLKVNFHCAHWYRFFPLKEALSKPTSPPLNLKFFLKSTRPSLPLKKAPPLISVFSPQGKRGNRPTRCSEPFHSMDGGPSEVYASSGAAVFCAGMNPPSLKDLLRGCLLDAFFENLPVLPYP